MAVFQSAWYLIYTRIRCEKKVANELRKSDIEYYLPTKKALHTWHDRKKFIETPLFPSYVFVYLKSIEDYYMGLKADGTMFYVKCGKETVIVDEKIIQDLKAVVENGKDVEVTTEPFRSSQSVVIKEGPLCGLMCEVVEYQKRERIIVRLNFLNRNVLIDVSEHQLVLAERYNEYTLQY